MAKALTKSQLATKKREEVLALIAEFLENLGEEVMRESGNSITYPSLDENGNELYVKVAVSIPRGGHDGEGYNGHEVAKNYEIHCAEVKANQERIAKERSEKAAKAKAKREAAKAKKEAEAAKRAKFLAKEGE